MPLGEQDFGELRKGNMLYVDKTQLIYRLANGAKFNFLSRPRRFGKSLMISTLKEYFQGNKALFKGLAINELEDAKGETAWQKHEVFHFDFSGGNYKRDAINALHNRIRVSLEPIEAKYNIPVNSNHDYPARFLNALKVVSEKSGNNAVVLIDEYDAPLFRNIEIGKGEPETAREELKGFYSILKTATPYIRFAILTGVTRFSQMSVFSGLNQLNDLSFDKNYSAICGITQQELENYFAPEIKLLGDNNGLTYDETLAELKEKYDGYDFTGLGVKVYNPFSTINVLANSEFENYWFHSGTPTFLIDEITRTGLSIPRLDKGITKGRDEIMNYRLGKNDAVALLFQTGYLTVSGISKVSDGFILSFPNSEVKYGFYGALVDYFSDHSNTGTGISATELIEDLATEDLDTFFDRLTAFYSGIPNELYRQYEEHYHIIFHVLFTLMGQIVKSEASTSFGRSDLVIELPEQVYIFEFKTDGNGTADDALAQIDEKGYATKYKSNPSETRKIYCVGVVFDNEKKTIGEWKSVVNE
jgi:hypothetical protein